MCVLQCNHHFIEIVLEISLRNRFLLTKNNPPVSVSVLFKQVYLKLLVKQRLEAAAYKEIKITGSQTFLSTDNTDFSIV